MSDFGDKDIFDVWDDGDPFELKLRILQRIAEELREQPNEIRRLEALRLLVKLQRLRSELSAQLEAVREALGG